MGVIDKIIGLAEERGLSQGAIESHCGLPRGRISKWKNGDGEPTGRQLWRIANMFEVPIRYLVDDAMTTPEPDMNEVEHRILWLAKQAGYDRAIARLMGLPENPSTQRPPAALNGQPRALGDANGSITLPSRDDAKPKRGKRRA